MKKIPIVVTASFLSLGFFINASAAPFDVLEGSYNAITAGHNGLTTVQASLATTGGITTSQYSLSRGDLATGSDSLATLNANLLSDLGCIVSPIIINNMQRNFKFACQGSKNELIKIIWELTTSVVGPPN